MVPPVNVHADPDGGEQEDAHELKPSDRSAVLRRELV